MLLSTIIRRDLNVTRRTALWLVALVAFIAGSAVPANAEMICPVELVVAKQLFFSLDHPYVTVDSVFGTGFTDLSGCGAGASNSEPSDTPSPTVPSEPIEPQPSETPKVGLGVLGASSGAGASPSSSGNGSPSANAILLWISELPKPTLVGYLNAVELLEIPPAPPFELLRPPHLLTIPA